MLQDRFGTQGSEALNNLCRKVTRYCPIYEDKADNVTVTGVGIVQLEFVNAEVRFNTNLARMSQLPSLLLDTPALKCMVQTDAAPPNDHFYFLIFVLNEESLYPLFIFQSIRPNVYSPEFKIYKI